MEMSRELLQKALDLLNEYHDCGIGFLEFNDVFDENLSARLTTEIEAELAKPEAEPVAWMLTGMVEHGTGKQSPMLFAEKPFVDGDNVIPLYISPRPMQRLTESEKFALADLYNSTSVSVAELIEAVEAKVMEKNR